MEGKKSETPVLPPDVITDILVRLPVESIGRFRCVSKPWLSLLTSPGFIKDHLNLHMNDPQHLIFTSKSRYSTSPYIRTITPGSGHDAISSKVNFTFGEKPFVGVNNSCHGLVLFIDWIAKFSTFLMNPITLEAMQVPDPDGPFSMCCSLGPGYDSSSDDYKIVSLDGLEKFVDIYSAKARTWRRTGGYSCCLRPSYYGNFNPGIYNNGCLHWIAYDDKAVGIPRPVILALSLASEEFEEVPFPSLDQYNNCDALDIMFLDGFLALVRCSCRRGSVDVWIMKEYGVQTSWTKPITITCSDRYEEECELRVVCLLGEDEIVLEKPSSLTKFVSYNWRNGTWRDLVVAGGIDSDDIRLLMPFRGSLVPPN